MICRLLPHEVRPGSANMAMDEALLDAVDADPTAAVLRTYEWSEPTLSLGYFQSYEDARSQPRFQDVPLVRRPSGGGALWHDREITYALVLPRSHPITARASDLYRGVHAAIAEGLRSQGIAAKRRGPVASRASAASRPFLCFLDDDPEDILLEGHKIVGSAQRRRTHAVLQHGSVLMAASPQTPELPGLAELAEEPLSVERLSRFLREALCGNLSLTPVDSPRTAEEGSAEACLRREVYEDATWTEQRRRSRS